MTPSFRGFIVAVPVLVLLACGPAETPIPADSGSATADAGTPQAATDVAGQPGVDSGAEADAGFAGEVGTDSGTQPEAGSPTGVPWTLIALPDTQYYSSTYPEIFDAQTNWIINNTAALNIRYVLHEGDIVDSDVDGQWTNASHSMHLLDLKVPYALAVGNHDYPGGGGAISRDTTLFDTYFSLTSLDWQITFKGTYEPANSQQ